MRESKKELDENLSWLIETEMGTEVNWIELYFQFKHFTSYMIIVLVSWAVIFSFFFSNFILFLNFT